MLAQTNAQLRIRYFICIVFYTCCLTAQNIDIENIGKGKPFKVSGNIAANSVFYNSNQNTARAPFTYFLQGTLNFSIYDFSIPVSYSYSNQGENLEYQLPFNFNRLSLHPKYKWVQAHIGDVNMTFSPYTLSGHQFTGGGVELTPSGPVKFSAMYGRLLKATEDDDKKGTEPAFKRMGYGAKAGFEKENYAIELIGFYAKDALNSIRVVPEEKKVFPKENLVISGKGAVTIIDGLKLKGEYASSAITQDIRAEKSTSSSGIAGSLFNNRTSTEYHTAYKTDLEYSFDVYKVGVGYERIDPGYQTLGGYFFNNDFENITLNGTTVLFNSKLNLSFNVGYQRDDLKRQKETFSTRTVGSLNAAYTVNKKLNFTGSYSNFTTFTNNRLNQFETINDDNLLDNQDERFNYKQLSQNATASVNYVISSTKEKRQNINVNYALSSVANAEDGIVRVGNASIFHNVSTAYTLGFPKTALNITTALNATYNTIGREDATTWGPTLNIGKKFFSNKMNTVLGVSYNNNQSKTGIATATNIRATASYLYKKKHNFNVSAIQLFRANKNRNSQDITVTFGYNYAFDLSVKKKHPNKKEKSAKVFGFTYRTHEFKGEPYDITPEVLAIAKSEEFREISIIEGINDELSKLEKTMKKEEAQKKKEYKAAAINYLDYLYANKNALKTYYDLAFKSLKKLYADGLKMDYRVKKRYERAQVMYNDSFKPSRYKQYLKKRKEAYEAHTYMLENLKDFKLAQLKEETGILAEFRNKHVAKVLKMQEEEKTELEIYNYLEVEFAKMYHKQANKK